MVSRVFVKNVKSREMRLGGTANDSSRNKMKPRPWGKGWKRKAVVREEDVQEPLICS